LSAHRAFLDGVKCDPGFTFIKDAFFEPKAENDFQTALRMYMARRLPEALFYMTRYTDAEQRTHYKALGQQWVADIRDNIANQKDLRLAQYPVLLDHVRSVALNNAANLIAFVTIQKSTDYDFITDLWLLDTETGKTRKRLTLPEVTIMDIAFVGDSNTLRLLGGAHRYELDAVSEGNTYYIYDNTSHAFPLFLTSSGQGIGRMRDDLSIEVANWREQNTALVTPLKTSMDIQQVSVRHDGKLSALVKSKQVFIGSDSTLVYPQEEGDWDTHTVNMEVSDVAIHPEKNLIALGMQSGTLLVDVQGNPLELYGSPGLTPISKIAFSPNGKKMAAFGAQTVEIWNVENVDAEVYTSEYTIDMCAEVPTVEEVESWNAESENDEKTE
jgi:WD40 repeat protein